MNEIELNLKPVGSLDAVYLSVLDIVAPDGLRCTLYTYFSCNKAQSSKLKSPQAQRDRKKKEKDFVETC